MTVAAPTDHRLAAAFVARLLGLVLVGLALLVLIGTVVVALAGLPVQVLVAAVLAAALAVVLAAWWLRTRGWVLRCTDDGYRLRYLRGAGVARARWVEVEDVVTTHRRGVACLELRLRDGRTTTVPVGVLAVDREQLVRDLQERLQRGHGLRPL